MAAHASGPQVLRSQLAVGLALAAKRAAAAEAARPAAALVDIELLLDIPAEFPSDARVEAAVRAHDNTEAGDAAACVCLAADGLELAGRVAGEAAADVAALAAAAGAAAQTGPPRGRHFWRLGLKRANFRE